MKPGIHEQQDLQTLHAYTTQVCIIGSGCGGATLAQQLAKKGLDVVVLERGGYYPPEKMDQNELNMQGKLYGGRGLDTTSDGGNTLLYGNNVGGASVHYWADSYRTPQYKLDEWQEQYGVRNHQTRDLEPAFDALEREISIHEAPDSLFNPLNQRFRQASQSLGWHGHRVPQARTHCQKSGHCMQGCIYGAKQDQTVTHLPDAIEHGARVFADSRAESLSFEGRRAKRLRVSLMDRKSNRPSGQEYTVEADVFVVAAGGFSSSHFLLRQGLGDDLPALGRHFSMNPSTMVYGLFEEDMRQWRNIPAAWGVDEFLQRQEDEGRYREGGYLLMPNQIHPGALAATLPLKGEQLGEWMAQFPQLAGTIAWMDDIPEELGEIRMRRDGGRQVHYPYGALTRQVLKDSVAKQLEMLFAMGARKAVISGHQAMMFNSMDDMAQLDDLATGGGGLIMASPHPGGGCRMGDDPAQSVVGSDHRVHGYDNLFVSDSSVFPTSSALDPSLSIMAFSHMAANHVLETFS